MKVFFAFSTGAMMGRILAKLLGRKNVDLSNRTEIEKIMNEHSEELQKAQELVKQGGVFEKFITDTLLNGVDNSYKNQFVNWAWVALADSNEVFDRYIKKFDSNGIKADTHYTTEFTDRVGDFCNHMKKHADFKQKCREILNKVNAKQDHISIEEFSDDVLEMNTDWDSRRKYTVNDETIDEAWRNIERNEIHVDGSWGDFHAYTVPSWTDLMQVANQTNWCVAQKGESGLRMYNHYGAPYYLICDRRREPFALLNPNSKQYKDVKDYAIKIRDNGDALPSHRRAIVFGKAVLDKVAPNMKWNSYDDFGCFNHVDEILQMDAEDRNDTTDYDKVVSEMPDETVQDTSGNTFLEMMNSEGRYGGESMDRYMDMTPEDRNGVVDDILSALRAQGIKAGMVDDLMYRGEGDRLLKLINKNTNVIGYDKTVGEYINSEINNYLYYRYDRRHQFDNLRNLDDIVRRIYVTADKDDKMRLIEFSVYCDQCSKNLSDELTKNVDFSKMLKNSSMAQLIIVGIKNGKMDKSMLQPLEEVILREYRPSEYGYGMNIDSSIVVKVMESESCSERLRKYVYNLCKSNYRMKAEMTTWGSMGSKRQSVVGAAIRTSTGEVIDEMMEKLENETNFAKIEAGDDAALYAATIRNPKCPPELIVKVLERVDYGRGAKVDKYSHEWTDRSIYAALFESGKLTEEQFMKILKTNPRLVVVYGWNSPYCTDVVKLALAKKVGKANGQIFHFNKDENHVVMEEFYKSRLSAGRYAEYIEGIRNGVVPDEVLRQGIMKINVNNPKGMEALERSCKSNRLSAESIEYVYDHREECVSPFNRIAQQLFRRDDIDDRMVERAVEDSNNSAIEAFLNSHKDAKSKDAVAMICASYCPSDRVGQWNPSKDEYNSIAKEVLKNPNCPDSYTMQEYEPLFNSDGYDELKTEVMANVISNGLLDAKKICDGIEKIRSGWGVDFTKMVQTITSSQKYNSEEKTAMIMKIDMAKVAVGTVDAIASACTGKQLFKKIALSLSHENDSRGRALAENENYGREQIAPIINRNYGVAEGYYSRFGVDDAVIRCKHLYKIIDNHFSDFTKEDRLKVLHCDNEDAVWLMKKYIRQEMQLQQGVVNASRMRSIAMRVAVDSRVSSIAQAVAMSFAE